jgi:hypothetical protein
MDYCNGVHGFINYAISNPRYISGGRIRCPYKRCKNKKFLDPDIVTMYLLQKKFMEEYLYWYAHGEPFVPHETMIKRIIGSTSSASNVYGIVDNNNNPYRTMVMDAMRMNQSHVDQFSIVNEEPNVDVARLLKDSDKPL